MFLQRNICFSWRHVVVVKVSRPVPGSPVQGPPAPRAGAQELSVSPGVKTAGRKIDG